MPLVATWFIAGYGWRLSYLVLGIISALCIISTAQLLKRDPAEKGLQPYGALESGSHGSNTIGEGLTLQEAIRTWQFWMVCVLYFISWYCARTVMVHIAPHTLDLGFSAVQAASIISVIGATSILGRVAMGGSGDRIGNKRAVLICFAVLATMLLWLHGAKALWALYIFAAIYGFSHGGFFALVSPLVAELMGTRSHGVILGLVLAISQTGGALGTVVAGRIFDITGSYQLAFILLNVMSITGLILSGLLKPIRVNSASPSGDLKK
jgi:MFS family permease